MASDLRSEYSLDSLSVLGVDGSSLIRSLPNQVLGALAEFFHGISPPRELDGQEFKDHVAKASRIAQVLHALAGMKFDKPTEELSKSRGASIKKGKRPKRASISGSVMLVVVSAADSEAFRALNLAAPSSEVEASDLLKGLTDSHREILFYFLGLLELDSIRELVLQKVLRIIAPPSDVVLPQKIREANEHISIPEATDFPVKKQPLKLRFPMIAPEKARHAFQWPSGFGDWPIHVSAAAIKHLRQFRRGDGTFRATQEKIAQLSQGLFSESNQKRLEGAPTDVPIFEAKVTGDLRLVYRIDIDTDHYLKMDKQVIKVYGVYTHDQFDHRLWTRIAHSSPRNDREHMRKVNYRMEPRRRGAKINIVTPPMTWPHEGRALVEHPPPRNTNMSLTEDECLELHKIWSLTKFVPYSTDIDAEHEFSVSPAEENIIQHPSSCFVIGWSGTGKTTTMLFKLLMLERAQQSNLLGDFGPIRQMFLTQSHVLASKVEEYYLKLLEAAQLGMPPTPKDHRRGRPAERHITEFAEDADDRPDLPTRYSDLKEQHFPLFLTYDQLRRMLEVECGIESPASSRGSRKPIRPENSMCVPLPEPVDEESWDTLGSLRKGYRDRNKNVTFDMGGLQRISPSLFKSQYWIHFDQQKIKGLDAAQVYSEIMGVICGHEDTLETQSGCYMDRESYMNLSHRSHPSFSTARDRVYDIFEKYLKLKMLNNAFDSPGRTHAILKHIDESMMKIDFLYVDEIQDLLTIDTKLLRDLCPNPHGHFWGGDTAQTISVGSSFRFEDLKALVYREELSDRFVASGAREPVNPEVFQLPINYRSHQGIVACAGSIIDLITTLFPYSIDKLQREESTVPGPEPLIFRHENVHWGRFSSEKKNSESCFQLGARQAIIVRDDVARDEVRTLSGSQDNVYTLIESKGLEFDDVLIYNFFASSPASGAQWRAILGVQRADATAYRVLEVELKRLYVALTRARFHVWVWDSSRTADPMVFMIRQSQFRSSQAASYFHKSGRYLDRDIALAYQQRKDARAASNDDRRIAAFSAAGLAFQSCARRSLDGAQALQHNAAECFVLSGDFQDAAKIFEEAGQHTDAAICYHKAHLLEDVARLVFPSDGSNSLVTEKTRERLLGTIRIHYLCAGDFERAASLFDCTKDQISFVEEYLNNSSEIVASIYEHKGDYISAAKIYSSIGQDMKAASHWLRSDSPEAQTQAASALLDAMWKVAFNTVDAHHVKVPWAMLSDIPTDSMTETMQMEMQMFRAIIGRDVSALCALGRSFEAKELTTEAVLSFNHVLRGGLDLGNEDLSGLCSKLAIVESYCRQLIVLLRERRICDSTVAQRLAGFFPAAGKAAEHVRDEFCAAGDSYAKRLVEQASSSSRPTRIVSKMREGSVHVRGEDLHRLLRQSLGADMQNLLVGIHSELLGAGVLQPCLGYLLHAECNRVPTCRALHLEAGSRDMLSRYFRVHMQIVVTLDCMWHLPATTMSMYRPYGDIRHKWIGRIFSVLFPVTRMSRDHMTFDSKSPEARRAMPIVRSWVDYRIRGLDRHSEDLITLDRNFATNIVMLPLMAYVLHGRRFLRNNLKTYPVPRKQQVGLSSSREAVYNGARFLQWVVEAKPPIDLNVVVHYLELLCMQLVFEYSMLFSPLHNLLLPRSWAPWVLDMFSDSPPTVFCITRFLAPVIDILHALSSRDGYGFFTLRGSVLPSWSLRQEMIARICLGFNGPQHRADIFNAIKTLDFSPPGERYARFVKAKSWWEMVQALTAHGDPDSLVILCQISAENPAAMQVMVECAHEPTQTIHPSEDKDKSGHDNAADPLIGSNVNKTVKQLATKTEDEIRAAAVLIQRCYRRLAAKRILESSEFQKVFLACVKNINFQPNQGPVNRIHFFAILRGPLPHVLFVLSRVLEGARDAKHAAKSRLDTVELGDLMVECQNQITVLNLCWGARLIPENPRSPLSRCCERMNELLREIGPESSIFRSGSFTSLEPQVLEVDALLKKFESTLTKLEAESLKFHMAMGIKGIVTPSAPQMCPPNHH
ncbi:uncharacterized protein EI90DRAFT_3013934 [Cantharellus anzutake]|uniref:uncharacterized protein n=1 Tax=Cantharellus anzutake TaxID=1750568 RepID=UPI0019062D31|nr:uncharacterized protein EI90DRAFT_3013934 [Cantharellus anzutake]KAF8336960.1 hypothetical protein EI90DRAFT_3013934 [Cantharellus anzutake]